MALSRKIPGTPAKAAVVLPALTEQWRQAQERVATAERRMITASILAEQAASPENIEQAALTVRMWQDAKTAEAEVFPRWREEITSRVAAAVARGGNPKRVQGIPK